VTQVVGREEDQVRRSVCRAGGINKLSEAHPDVEIHLGSVDSHLKQRGCIVPGMGDAGDRQFSGE